MNFCNRTYLFPEPLNNRARDQKNGSPASGQIHAPKGGILVPPYELYYRLRFNRLNINTLYSANKKKSEKKSDLSHKLKKLPYRGIPAIALIIKSAQRSVRLICFIRPQWQSLLVNLKKYRGKVDFVLFTKWDRFSRNAPDAYQMINTLKILGVDPQAIEQPLDMTVPENKMMLAIYLTAPEIENDRRALNTFFGMRRARKEGRWVSHAPIGYLNRHDDQGKKYIAINEPQATIIRWAFNEISLAKFSTEQIYLKAASMGLKCQKNNFLLAIRNPVYCGRILIVKYRDEEAHTVKGIHKGLFRNRFFMMCRMC